MELINKMLQLAKETSQNAYVPYSHFHLGCVVLTDDGELTTGFNIENASYGATMCAERVTLYRCYAKGYCRENIKAMLLYAPQDHIIYPCGECLQVMIELIDPLIPLYISYDKGMVQTTLSKLLPFSFKEDDLNV